MIIIGYISQNLDMVVDIVQKLMSEQILLSKFEDLHYLTHKKTPSLKTRCFFTKVFYIYSVAST